MGYNEDSETFDTAEWMDEEQWEEQERLEAERGMGHPPPEIIN